MSNEITVQLTSQETPGFLTGFLYFQMTRNENKYTLMYFGHTVGWWCIFSFRYFKNVEALLCITGKEEVEEQLGDKEECGSGRQAGRRGKRKLT